MKVIVISMVKDEQDVIESFVRHCFTFCDEMIICDHMSSDRTPEILRLLQAEGLAITIERETNPTYIQSEVMTRLMHEAGRRGADWVLPLDADEFVLPERDGDSVRAALAQFDQPLYKLPWRHYAPAEPHVDEDKFLLARPAARKAQPNGTKVLIGSALALNPQFILMQGNHELYVRDGAGKIFFAKAMTQQRLAIAHYVYRSPEQHASKIALLWINTAAKYTRCTVVGDLSADYQQLMERGPLAWAELTRGLAQQTVPTNSQGMPLLRYSQRTRPNYLRNIMSSTLQLADRVALAATVRRGVAVTVVVPHLGDGEAFSAALQTATAQDYPFKQVLAVAYGGGYLHAMLRKQSRRKNCLPSPAASMCNGFCRMKQSRLIACRSW